jgi:hypothetical protein
MSKFDHISNEELSRLINSWIKSECDRKILHRRLIDGICYDELSTEFHLSVDRIKQIVYKQQDILFRRIECEKTEVINGQEWYIIPT